MRNKQLPNRWVLGILIDGHGYLLTVNLKCKHIIKWQVIRYLNIKIVKCYVITWWSSTNRLGRFSAPSGSCKLPESWRRILHLFRSALAPWIPKQTSSLCLLSTVLCPQRRGHWSTSPWSLLALFSPPAPWPTSPATVTEASCAHNWHPVVWGGLPEKCICHHLTVFSILEKFPFIWLLRFNLSVVCTVICYPSWTTLRCTTLSCTTHHSWHDSCCAMLCNFTSSKAVRVRVCFVILSLARAFQPPTTRPPLNNRNSHLHSSTCISVYYICTWYLPILWQWKIDI